MDEDLAKHTFPVSGGSLLFYASGVVRKAELIVSPERQGVLLSTLKLDKNTQPGFFPLDFFSGKPLHCGLLWAPAVVVIHSPADAPSPVVRFEELDNSLTWDNVFASTGKEMYEEVVGTHSRTGPVKLTIVYTKGACAFRK